MFRLKSLLLESTSSSSEIKKTLEDFLKRFWDRDRYEDHYASEEFDYEEWFEAFVKDEIRVSGDRVVFRFTSYNHFFDYKTYKSERKVTKFFNDLVEDKGWFVSSVSLPNKANSGLSRIRVVFEKDKAERVDPPKKLYHVTEADNLSSIKERGLVPKKGDKFSSFLYPERVYLFKDRDVETIKRFVASKMTMNVSPEVMCFELRALDELDDYIKNGLKRVARERGGNYSGEGGYQQGYTDGLKDAAIQAAEAAYGWAVDPKGRVDPKKVDQMFDQMSGG